MELEIDGKLLREQKSSVLSLLLHFYYNLTVPNLTFLLNSGLEYLKALQFIYQALKTEKVQKLSLHTLPT
jgi:hypothetical protein